MERLTRKSLEYKDTWIADGSVSNIECVVRGRVIDLLAEFEDLMEKYGLNIISDIEDMFLKFKHIQHTNQALKGRWEKLKALLEEDMEHNSKEYDESLCPAFQHYSATENWVLDRMEELEKED